MAKVIIHLLDPEMSALHRLAQREYRPVRSQAALIIRNELKRLGMVTDLQAANAAQVRELVEADAGGAA
jgi:hypothetical protein